MKRLIPFCLIAVACKGGDDDSGWTKAKRTDASAAASGIAFTIQIPEGFTKGGDDKRPEWKTDKVDFGVSSTEQRISSVKAAIEKISLPGDQYTYEKQEALADGVVIRRLSTPQKPGVVFVDVFKSGASGNLHCHAGAQASGQTFKDLPGTLSAMEAVCLSMTIK